jgi:protein TonB
MFDDLIESKPKKQKTVGQTAMSVVIHVLLVLGAIKATQGAAEAVADRNERPIEFVVNTPPPPPPPPQEIPPDAVVTANPPPQGFQTIVPPRDLPTEIPPVDLNQKFDARDFSGRGQAGGVAAGVIGGTGPVITDAIIDGGQTFTVDEVDEPVVMTSGPGLRYPEAMRAVGIDGVVQLRYVVGTNGRVESGSITVVSSTNKAFENAAIETVRQSRYSPAKMRGQPVRQLVQQTFRFSLTG